MYAKLEQGRWLQGGSWQTAATAVNSTHAYQHSF
jgi:hypothetical protein